VNWLFGEEVLTVGMTLFDQKSDAIVFDVNFWHWRAIVEAIRSLGVLPEKRVDALHEQFVGELTQEETRAVAVAIRERLLPTLADDERLLLDGRRTTEPDDGTFYRDPAEQHRNYSTNRRMLEEFVKCCETCGGFRVS
jgi:Fe2+ transport system protein FeoA